MIKGRKIPAKALSERDDQDLVLFRDLHKREKDRMSSLLQPVSDDFESNPPAGNFALYRMASGRKGPGHEFFAENDKNDYDWLKTPPATPLFPSLEMEANAPADRLILQRDIPILQPLSRSRFGSDSATKGASKSNTNGRPKSPKPKPKPKPTMRYVTPTQNSLTQTNNNKPTISSTSTNPKNNTKPTNVIGNTSRVVHMDFLSSNISKNSSSGSSNIVTKTKGRSRGVSPSSTRSSTLIIPIDIPGFSNETPPNLMTDITRSTSATRGRPTAAPSSSAADHINRSTSATRRQSRSPSVTRGRKHTTEDQIQIQIQAGKTSIAIRNSNSIGTQFLGSRMVDKLMNARSKSDRESSTTTRPKSRGSVSAVTTPNKMMSRTSLDNHIMVQETNRDRNGSRQLGKSSSRE